MPSEEVLRLAARYRAQAISGDGGIQLVKNVYEFATKFRSMEGQPFNLDRFLPLQVLYEDDWPLIDVMKPAQRGVSEWAISLVYFALDQGAQHWVPNGLKSGLNVGYVFPARGDLIEFSKERLSGLKDESRYLADMVGDDDRFDSLAFKQVRNSFLYLRGGYSTTGLRSFPCDVLILDEFDELDPGAVSLARKRLNASLVKRMTRISTPTIPGRGISAAFAASDQRTYQTMCQWCATECSHCGKPMDAPKGTPCGAHCPGYAVTWNSYDFFRDVWADNQPFEEWSKWTQVHVDVSDVELRCPTCHKPQSSDARCQPGRWVALQPEITRVHGYHIPWWPWPEMMMALKDLAIEAVSEDPTDQEQFFRSDLGLPHGVSGGQITEEMLRQLTAELPDGKLPDGPWHDTVLGCDIGARLYYHIDSLGPDNKVYVRATGSVPDFAGLNELMEGYGVRMGVVDAEPEWHASQEFCQRFKGRAMRCFYANQATALKSEMYVKKKDLPDLQAHRVMLLDLVYATIARAQERWPLDIAANEEVIKHYGSVTRVRDANTDTGAVTFNWVRSGPDHLVHAHGYALLARKMLPPPATSFQPATAGSRQVVADYSHVSALNLGRLADRRIPPWIPPAVR